MDLPRHDIDPDGLLEYSVVFTDRSLNHMSRRFVGVMQEGIDILRSAYDAHSVAFVPGGGTYAMESVARQFATGRPCLVIRNGLFSYRWSQIFEQGSITDDVTVCMARPTGDGPHPTWQPAPVEEVVATIREKRPAYVFAPHVETAAGIILPDDYLDAVSAATHEVGGLFVLDCVASGAMWVDMRARGVDLLISAPQKGWSGSPCTGFVMFGDEARRRIDDTTSTSFALDLKKWLGITEGYADGKAGYHATLPTDAIARDVAVMRETRDQGFDRLRTAQEELGGRMRKLLGAREFDSVAAPEFASPTVVVVYTDDPELRSGAAFAKVGLQVAAGVPLMCGEPKDFSTFRVGLFGLDKLDDIDGTVARFEEGLDRVERLER